MGSTAAAAWDVLAKAANLAQMSGLHAAVLVAVLTTVLRVQQSNRRECARLERRLHALQWPATGTGCGGIPLLLCSDDGDPFVKALGDAAGVVDSYKGSTPWRRLWSGRRMATQLRDMQDVVDSYCGLVLFVNAHLLLQEAARHPSSPDTSTTTYVRAMQITTSLPKLKTYTF
jgi:hypothetical protein